MATVYKAYHPALDRFVAIKGMHIVFSQDPNFQARFQREAKVVALLEHPNIVPVYDFAEQNGQPYLVMKYIPGETLKARLGRGALEPSELGLIVRAIANALSYAHDKGILHRDIKPSNVLLAEGGGIYLTDFGLARIAQAGESTLSADMMLGTPQYISPEQARGTRDLNEGTDIYSFGVLLYELVVGEVPFNADTPYSIVHDHIYKPLPLPRIRNPKVSPELERVLLKTLAKDPVDRYHSVNDVLEAFLTAMEKKPVSDETIPILREDDLVSPGSPASSGLQLDARLGSPEATEERPSSSISSSESSLSEKAPRRRGWLWVLGGILVCSIGVFGILTLLSVISEARNNRAPTEIVAATAVPGDSGSNQDPDAISLAEALERVEANPDDPFAFLELAAAYHQQGNIEKGAEAFRHAREIGRENREFLRTASEFLIARELWIEAVEVLVDFARINNGLLPPDLLPQFERALYNSAADERIRNLDPFGEERPFPQDVNPLFFDVFISRRILFFGEIEEGQRVLEQILMAEPEYPPGLLLQSEYLIEFGEVQHARELLRDLIAREPVQSWVGLEARRLFGR